MMRVAVVLTAGCSWLAAALLTEPWRIANRDRLTPAATWDFHSWSGSSVVASNGMELAVAGRCQDLDVADCDAVIVLASEIVWEAVDPDLITWISELGETEILLGGIDAGPHILAKAGVLVGHAAALHHELLPAFSEQYLGIELTYGRYTLDEYRATCAGSATTLDFSLALLGRFSGQGFSAELAETLMHSPHADPGAPAESTTTLLDDRLRRAMHVIASSTAEPGVVALAADAANISDRHLHRLFRESLGMSPTEFARRVRMRRARTLLRETRLPIGHVATACGYGGTSEFGRVFRKHFGMSPTALRSAAR